jgi:SAM-dependent methyltransferase
MTMSDYFQYEAQIARNHLVPLLLRHGALAGGVRVLDVGCGYGGTLLALREAVSGLQGVGLDLDARMVRQGQERLGEVAKLVQADFFQWSEGPFDLVLMRDVLEHIRDPELALARAAALLAPAGFLFASFAPFFGPFGGHQHNASGAYSFVPWIQIFPEGWCRRLLPVRGNAYKAKDELESDLQSVFATRLTLRRFHRAAAAAGFRFCFQAGYLSRPDYRMKFGWPSLRVPMVPGLIEILATGVEALMRKSVGADDDLPKVTH